MSKRSRQLDSEIAEALSKPRSNSRQAFDELNDAIRHYEWLSEASTTRSPGRTPEAWDSVAARIETAVETAMLEGDKREFALARARDARANARFLRRLDH